MMSTINVTKASGDQEPFQEEKLRQSLANAGADNRTREQIVKSIRGILHEGISTQKIYREAFRQLKYYSDMYAGRYKLKEALLELGPTGYPFEKFVAELLNRQGYQTEVGIIVEGNCVSHEIDVIAQKDEDHFMIECKFHNRKDHKCNVKVPLYIQARFEDVKKNWSSLPGHENKNHRAWVVTNTRFTKDARQYGQCIGLRLLSWDYPKDKGLKDLISRVNLHPITCLSTLTKEKKQELLERDVIFCMQICEDDKILNRIGINNRDKNKIVKEAQDICHFSPFET